MDYNNKITEKITEYQNQRSKSDDGFVSGFANIEKIADSDNIIGRQLSDDDVNNQVAISEASDNELTNEFNQSLKEMEAQKLAQANKQAEGIIEVAREDARIIVESATNEAETIRQNAWNEGYVAGEAKAKAEAEAILNSKLRDLANKEQELLMDYQNKVNELEPRLAETIFTVISEITKVIAEDKKEVVLNLVNTVLSDNPIGRNFFIRVSKDDADFLRENKDKIVGVTNKDINIEIIADSLMKSNECLIETDFGVFDSSLDVQLSNLAKDIKLLACAMGSN